MECVRVFNNELSSLYEVKPPISKAKMTQITKSAIKGIKFYKHIVQSVEKFIQKCRSEYKVPGLYVVDSIVRQSRHQFGADKDVFGPRFVKNITITFQHLFKCPEDERSKIIRVLNLWQKNAVFPIEVIQPLLDMGHPNSAGEWPLDTPADIPKESPVKVKEEPQNKSSPWKGWPQGNEEHVQDNKTYAEMSTKNLEKFNKAEMSNSTKEEEASRSSMFRNQVKLEQTAEETVKFNKKLLDFDYGDEEDEEEPKNDDSNLSNTPNALALSMAQNLLSNPELLRQLQQMTAGTIQPCEVSLPPLPVKTDESEPNYSQDIQNSPLVPPTSYQQPEMSHNLHLSKSEADTDDRVLPEPVPPPRDLDERSLASVMASHDRLLPSMCLPAYHQTGVSPKPPLPDKDDRTLPNPPLPTQDLDERSLASIILPPAMPPMTYPENANLMQFQFDKNGIPFQPPLPMMEPLSMEQVYPGVLPPDPHTMQNRQGDEDERMMYSMPGEPPLPPQDFDERQIIMPAEERGRKERSRSRSRSRGRSGRHRSRSRSPRRKRSTSRSRSRKNRSRSRERERVREKERDREKERERRRKGIPPVKKGCVSVCSTTLWLGHVPKSCSEVDISENFTEYGTILSIDMIPPRGCAYVVMDRRQDANRALQKLKNVKLQGSSIKMAWAPGKGVKGKDFKDCWEVELGVSYVPHEKIKEDLETLELLEEGGFIDEESLPEKLKALRQQPEDSKNAFSANSSMSESVKPYSEMPAAPNMVPPPIMPPTSVGLPMVMPHLMQPQFGLHLPGMLPHHSMVMQVPMGIPPPGPMLMVQQQSQGIMGNQPLPMVGGVPPMVPRPMPPVATTLSSHKKAVESALPPSLVAPPSNTVGDATPTEEESFNVNSPKIKATVPNTVTTTNMPVPSSQALVSMSHFNHMMGLNTNRPMISVPPPVSSAGTPIPYPPPNVGFNFPPPSIRPGQPHGMPPNAQFPWIQKQGGSSFTEAESNQSATSTPIRPVPPPQPGMPPHMLLHRLPFHDPKSSNVTSTSTKNLHSSKGKDNKGEPESLDSQNMSGQHDKGQEMVISTDDECSMDIEYSRSDMAPIFPPDFSRAPMNMPRMRGPPGPMPPGARFPPNMGSPFPMRMGGPRGVGGPGMLGRMDMDFSPRGPRGPRMPVGPHGSHRNDNMHPPPHDGRDWYPRDYEGPYFERERERRFRDDWSREGRDPWIPSNEMEIDSRRNSRDQRDREDDVRRDEHRESWNRDRSDNSRLSRDGNPVNEPLLDKPLLDKPLLDKPLLGKPLLDKPLDKPLEKPLDKPKPKTTNKSKNNKNLMDDLFRLRVYTKDSVDPPTVNRNDQMRSKPEIRDKKENKALVINSENNKKGDNSEQNLKREKDKEQRKRSRWGRTLSEEREFQQQKQNEIEMKQSEVVKKFQSYEQSQSVHKIVENPIQNTDISRISASNLPENNTVNQFELNSSIKEPKRGEIVEQNLAGVPEHIGEVNPCKIHVPIGAGVGTEMGEVNQNEISVPDAACVTNQKEISVPDAVGVPVVKSDINPSEISVPTVKSKTNPNEIYVSNSVSMNEANPVKKPAQSPDEASHNLETAVVNSTEMSVIAGEQVLSSDVNISDIQFVTGLNADVPLKEPESCNSSKNPTTCSPGSIENNNLTLCSEVLNVKESSCVENSTSNGNMVVADMDTNSSLLTSES